MTTIFFSITQSAENNGAGAAVIQPYGTLARHGEPKDLMNFFILHEGVVAMADGELAEIDYSDMVDFPYVDNEVARAEVDPSCRKWLDWLYRSFLDDHAGSRERLTV